MEPVRHLQTVFRQTRSLPRSGRSEKHFSPFSTEKLVYAGVVFRRSTRFPQLWTSLWIVEDYCLQTPNRDGWNRERRTALCSPKDCTLRTSCKPQAVEKAPDCDYNGDVLSARPSPFPA